MRKDASVLRLVQLLVLLLAIQLDAFALTPAGRSAHGGGQPSNQATSLNGPGKLAGVGSSLRSAQGLSPESRAKVPLTVQRMSGGGEGGQAASEEGDKSGMSASVFNLAKNILGAGMLSLPNGVAAFSDSKKAIIPASLIIAVLGAVSAYTFVLIGRSCAETNAESYEQSWARTVGQRSAWVPAGACVATCFAGCLAFTIIIGDSFSALAKTFGAPALVAKRSNIIMAVSATVLLPLSLLKNLKSLGFTSMLGTSGLVYTAVMMAIRFFDGSYAAGGKFHALLPAAGAPVFDAKGTNPICFLVLVSMLSTAYEAHFNAPLFYRELKDNTVPRYSKMVSTSFLASVATMTAVTAFGFLTFGGASSGYILNNYATTDRLATVARVAVASSLVFSYPLCFVGLRDGIREMGGAKPGETRNRTRWTVGLLAGVTAASLKLTDLGFVNSFGGALIGSGIVYVFPALMFLKPLMRKFKDKAVAAAAAAGQKREMSLNAGIVAAGVAMGVLGCVISVLETFTNVLAV
ncbi:unnamed protein product [Ectocarpus sp. CCAP 1310/34]|nr:unnamed protein product [Ectocarpus sp. CCAP 1310/34]